MASAARCAWARGATGAVATQNLTDPSLGTRILDMLSHGMPAESAVASLESSVPNLAYRQLLVVDSAGRTAMFSGDLTLGVHSGFMGQDCVAAGNLMANERVPLAMVEAFMTLAGQDLGDRLVSALKAGAAAGGEAGPMHSAGLLVVNGAVSWPVTDLRVDWTMGDPAGELADLWMLWKPQAADYVTRALTPKPRRRSECQAIPKRPGSNHR